MKQASLRIAASSIAWAINLGDIVVDGDDILGDGVNVADRLEGLAEPGGICISGMVHEGVRNKLDYKFDDLGEQNVKNITRRFKSSGCGSTEVNLREARQHFPRSNWRCAVIRP